LRNRKEQTEILNTNFLNSKQYQITKIFLVDLVSFVHLVYLVNKMNEKNQIDQTNEIGDFRI